jgi:hypothetical protein
MYGMGVDQWLEFQIVTADGKLKVANAVANPDLFWAIRGGGGGTFGVVVQATVKVHPHVPITTYAWSMISTSASIVNTVGIGNGSAGLYEAITYMASQLPSIADRASSAYLYMYPGRLRGFSITIAENATAEHIKSLWNPMLNKLSTFEGIPPHQSHILTFANYQEFMDYTYLDGMTSGCYTAVSKSSFNFPSILKPNTNCQKSTSAPADQQTVGKPQRKDPSAPGMFSRLDSILMGPDILLNPKLKETMKAMPVGGGWLMLSGNKAHRPDQDVSLLPAWRKAYVHAMSLDLKPLVTMDPYRKLAAEPSAYGNEVCELSFLSVRELC